MEKDHPCEFKELCEACHPEKEMAERRETCTDKNCRLCGVFWAFREGYFGMDED